MLEMNEDLIEQIAEYVSEGMFYTDAAAMIGVTATSVQNWLRLGTKDEERGLDTPHSRFSCAVKAARAFAQHDSITAIRRAGNMPWPGAWQAHAWYLERTDPENFGKQDRTTVQLNGKLGVGVISANLDVKPEDIPPDGASRLAEIAGILASGTNPESGAD